MRTLPQPQEPAAAANEPAALLRYLVESVVEAVVAEGRRAGIDDIDQRVAAALAFLRRRLTGDYVVDDLGFDAELTEALLPVLRPLYRSWFRVEVRGIENVPGEGGALVVANHSGAIALDAGYADQAHFIREFRYYMGQTPRAYLAREQPFMAEAWRRRQAVLGSPVQVLHPPAGEND